MGLLVFPDFLRNDEYFDFCKDYFGSIPKVFLAINFPYLRLQLQNF